MAKPTIVGSVYSADKDGFQKLVAEANKADRQGYTLVTIVPLTKYIGAIYRQRSDTSEESFTGQLDSFFE